MISKPLCESSDTHKESNQLSRTKVIKQSTVNQNSPELFWNFSVSRQMKNIIKS